MIHFLCVKYMQWFFRTSSIWNGKIVFFRRLYSWLLYCLQRNSTSLLLYDFSSSRALVLKHHSELQLSWLLNMCLRWTLLASLKSSIVFYSLFSIRCFQYLFIRIASALFRPHCWALLLLKMENLYLATTLTQWEGSARKGISGILSSIFRLDEFRTWPQAPLDGLLSTASIVMSF